MTTKNIRFLLKEIELYYDGDKFVAEGKKGRKPHDKTSKKKDAIDNLVEASLEYPRSGIPIVTTTKMMDLPSRTRVSLNSENFWESGLFKEDVDTETRFTLAISDKDSISKVGLWFRRILSIMFGSVTSGVSSISSVFYGAVASDLQSKLKKGLAGDQKKDSIVSLAESKKIHIELKPERVVAYFLKGKTKHSVISGNEITIDLVASRTIGEYKKIKNPGSKHIRKGEAIFEFKKGQKIGEAVIKIIEG